jgi:hypothetical protein
MVTVTWRGTDDEYARLQQAVARNCECVSMMLGLSPLSCPAHQMLAEQSALDHCLYVYRTRRTFITREFYALPIAIGRGPKRAAS